MPERLIRETDALGRLTGDALLLVDDDGIIVHATEEAAPLFGQPASELTGLPFGRPVTQDGPAEITIATTNRVVLLRHERIAEDDLRLARLHLRDITTLRAVEADLAAARQAAKAGERAKSHFLANITHEIRTPMIGILGMTELTLATELTGKQQEYLEMARHSAQSLLTVLNDIVDYARIEVGALELAKTPFDLRTTVEEAISVFRPLAAKKNLALEYRIQEGTPDILIGDASRLRQILINLVGNAVKFTDRGSVVVDITPRQDTQPVGKAALHFAVRDTGIGIPQDRITTIFERFTQADVSPTRRFQGAGLGLAIVRQLLERMGGSYAVTSQEGKGSVLSFVIPFAMPETDATIETAPPVDANLRSRPLTVLLAEDNPINQIYVQELLEMDGHEVVVAHTGRRALEILRRRRFDCILMDIQMPEMDGLEATRAIRADQSGDFDPHIPIVALTAHALKGDRETFLRAGMNEYLSKPVTPEELEAALARAVGVAGVGDDQASPEHDAPRVCLLAWPELLAKARGNAGFVTKLCTAFVAEQPANLEAMREALALNDSEQLAFMAHSLKGA